LSAWLRDLAVFAHKQQLIISFRKPWHSATLGDLGVGQMSAEAKIFERVLQKRIGDSEYWRRIEILEEGPFVFRVVQDHELRPMDNGAKRVQPATRSEWMCPSREAATEQALRCLHQSKNDQWVFSASRPAYQK
jgi:hypothetical protein